MADIANKNLGLNVVSIKITTATHRAIYEGGSIEVEKLGFLW